VQGIKVRLGRALRRGSHGPLTRGPCVGSTRSPSFHVPSYAGLAPALVGIGGVRVFRGASQA